uniref:Uncharacterized protein n=1 Tax=Chromera velia CCMP2878 TaxID=1169474 RepID=A0A0G4HT33_9ALVE|eukprot:Cvel_31279.t1-p1 / transcript=Cvel_31279.t1 / gene=Cvel_31279 / organism=Chromera_velia_CCMP2878 / gene_product=Putative ankyrin repeat protein MM_0045, putative / transcript_product=Putative ankyrin repeat protein MM_0045, putative / location=Cvel_scaffold4631:1622-3058(+) / protein_length=479 / sequence_SO=supercontig / SO=protein_coding / is_pseudo=false
MEETAFPAPPTVEAYLERLKALRDSVLAHFDRQIELVENALHGHGERESTAAAAAAAAHVRRVCYKDVSVLTALEVTNREFSKSVRGQLGEVISRHAKIDVGLLFELGIGGRILREFRPVSPETTQDALSNFVSGASNGDDFRLCLKAGADVNGLFEGQTALIRAVCANHMEAFQMILEDVADLKAKAGEVPEGLDVEGVVAGDTVVIVACRLRRWGMVRSLIVEGANVDAVGADGKKALQVACEAAENELDPELHNTPWREYKLHYDPQNGDPAVRSAVSEVLKDLLTKTSDLAKLKISARSAFHKESLVSFLSWHEFEELLLFSLSRGVDINATDEFNCTPLMNVVLRSRPHYVQTLIDNGALPSVNHQDQLHESALSYAVTRVTETRQGGIWPAWPAAWTVLEILVDGGADLNIQGAGGETVLHQAVRWGQMEVVQFLVERGADLHVEDVDGETPYDFAVGLRRPPQMLAPDWHRS